MNEFFHKQIEIQKKGKFKVYLVERSNDKKVTTGCKGQCDNKKGGEYFVE